MSTPYKDLQCLVCVGSTEFDQLIKKLDHPKFQALLMENGFTKLIFQLGQGTYKPTQNLEEKDNFSIEMHQFKVLEPIINDSELVISHCGAGVLLECLRSTNPSDLRTTNIAVVNTSLMDNH